MGPASSLPSPEKPSDFPAGTPSRARAAEKAAAGVRGPGRGPPPDVLIRSTPVRASCPASPSTPFFQVQLRPLPKPGLARSKARAPVPSTAASGADLLGPKPGSQGASPKGARGGGGLPGRVPDSCHGNHAPAPAGALAHPGLPGGVLRGAAHRAGKQGGSEGRSGRSGRGRDPAGVTVASGAGGPRTAGPEGRSGETQGAGPAGGPLPGAWPGGRGMAGRRPRGADAGRAPRPQCGARPPARGCQVPLSPDRGVLGAGRSWGARLRLMLDSRGGPPRALAGPERRGCGAAHAPGPAPSPPAHPAIAHAQPRAPRTASAHGDVTRQPSGRRGAPRSLSPTAHALIRGTLATPRLSGAW